MDIQNVAFSIMMGCLALMSLERLRKVVVPRDRTRAIVTGGLCALVLAVTLLREFYLEPIFAKGEAYMALLSLVALILNIALLVTTFIVYLTSTE
jgi:hypothetical protein